MNFEIISGSLKVGSELSGIDYCTVCASSKCQYPKIKQNFLWSGLEILQCRCFLNPIATLGIVKSQLMCAKPTHHAKKIPSL